MKTSCRISLIVVRSDWSTFDHVANSQGSRYHMQSLLEKGFYRIIVSEHRQDHHTEMVVSQGPQVSYLNPWELEPLLWQNYVAISVT